MKVAILFGGQSSERDVSISSASQVYRALKKKGHDVIAIDTAMGIVKQENMEMFLNSKVLPLPPEMNDLQMMKNGLISLFHQGKFDDIDICFLALHGGKGENGIMQGFLDIMGIPYTGPSHMPSAYSMDKDVAKTLFEKHGLPTPKWIMMPASFEEAEKHLSLPFVVKPNQEGSTVGLSIVRKREDFDNAVQTAYKYDDEVMLEQFIEGRELTVGILEEQALAVGEIIPKLSEIFDYKSKYMPGGAEEIFPAKLNEKLTDKIRKTALAASKAVKVKDYCRVDLRMDKDENIYLLEINTLPGMTATSLLPQSAGKMGISFEDLCERICALALKRYKK